MSIPDPIISLAQEYAVSTIFVAIGLFALALIIAIELIRHFRNVERMKYEFITIIAHKFQTPLSQIKWVAENVQKEVPDPYTKESMGELQKANERLIGLTGTLIEMTDSDSAAKSAYSFEAIDLCELIKSVADSMRSTYQEKNISFSVSCACNDITVKGDRARLEFVAQSVLSNAFTYTTSGKNVQASVDSKGSKAIFTVKDSGIGIDKKDISRIGDKFFRGHNSMEINTEGFGVSLHLSDAIIRRHRGSMFIHSDGIGKGTETTVVLPRIK